MYKNELLSIAIEAAKELEDKDDFSIVVVSMPCWELFDDQSEEYKSLTLGEEPRIGIEASIYFGWGKWLREKDAFIGMSSFGASGPAEELYDYFKINKAELVKKSKNMLK